MSLKHVPVVTTITYIVCVDTLYATNKLFLINFACFGADYKHNAPLGPRNLSCFTLDLCRVQEM